MAIEARRGCGYRKVGGLYLVAEGFGIPCCRLPFPLTVCPCCSAGIKQARGWTWVNPVLLFGGESYKPECNTCPAGNPTRMGERAGLLWIGERFYKTPADFGEEAEQHGISRRLAAVPNGFKLGETWVLLAHPKAIIPSSEAVTVELIRIAEGNIPKPEERVEAKPGIFRIFKPTRIEKIVTASQAKDEQAMADLAKRGITPVIVPDDDKDHQGTVYDKEDDDA